MQHRMRDFQDAMQREKGRRGNAARVAGWAASVLLSAGLLAGCGTSPPDNISLPTGGSASSPASPSSQTVSAPSAAAATPVQSHDLRTEPVRWEQSKPGCQGKHCPAITLDSLGFPDLPRLTVAIDQMLSSMTGVDENLSGVYGNVPGYAAYFWRTAQDGDHTWLRARLRGVSQPRARQILAGAVVAHAVMSELGVERLRVCPWALREGIMLRHLEANASGSVDLPLQPLVRLTDRPDATVTPLHQ